LVYLGILKLNKVLEVIVSITKVFVNLFIYIENSGTILVAKAIIIKVILNFKLTSISKLVTAKDLEPTILAKNIVNTITITKASIFKAFF
jgi:hypothetical protein